MSNEAIDYLNELSGATGVGAVQTYRMFFHGRETVVEVQDSGIEGSSSRYQTAAFFADLPETQRDGGSRGWTQGDPQFSVRASLEDLNWIDLEQSAEDDLIEPEADNLQRLLEEFESALGGRMHDGVRIPPEPYKELLALLRELVSVQRG